MVGGTFSGKDPSKVDRSAAYMARLTARTIVDAGLAAECEVGISYAIGKADPVAFEVDTLGTGEYADHILTAAARDVFVLRPARIIDVLNLRHPVTGISRSTGAWAGIGRAGNKPGVLSATCGRRGAPCQVLGFVEACLGRFLSCCCVLVFCLLWYGAARSMRSYSERLRHL